LLMPCGSRIVFLLTPLNPPTLPTKYILVGNQTSHHSICLAVKPTFTLLKSTSPSSVNAQLNVFMLDSHPKRVAIHSIIGKRGTYLNPEMLSLRNLKSRVRRISTLIVMKMKLAIQRGTSQYWINKRSQVTNYLVLRHWALAVILNGILFPVFQHLLHPHPSKPLNLPILNLNYIIALIEIWESHQCMLMRTQNWS